MRRFTDLQRWFAARLILLGATLSLAASAHAQSPARPANHPTTTPATKPSPFLDEKYDNGQLKSHYSILPNGVKHGIYALFYPDGKREERGNYTNGELDGARQVFYPSGQVKLSENYRRGQLDGAVREFDEKGNPVRMAEYAAGTVGHDVELKGGIPLSDRTYVDGLLIYPRSRVMIQAELDRIAKCKVTTVPPTGHNLAFDDEETPASREDALRRLMQYRYLSYVPYEDLKLDGDYCAREAAAANLCSAIGHLDHKPANPGWPDDRYKFGFDGTSHGNLFDSSRGRDLAMQSLEGYMSDSDKSNIDRVGHRRWCLNPSMGKTGFGSFKGFSGMWSMDHSNATIPPYEFIAYPSAGLYPSTYFSAGRAWSVSLNPERYAKPSPDAVKVTLTPVRAQMAQNKLLKADQPCKLDYEHIDLGGYGDIGNCIIFRPSDVRVEDGAAYLVEVSGIKNTKGEQTIVKYVVEFFKP